MKKHFWLTVALAVVLALAAVGPQTADAAQTSTATVGVRFVHALAGAGPVDIYVNDSLVAPSTDFTDATPHLNVPVGTHTISLRTAGDASTAAPILSQTVIVEQPRAGVFLTMLVQPDSNNNASVFVSEDDLNPAQLGQARLHFVHSIPDVGVVNILTSNGGPIASGIGFC